MGAIVFGLGPGVGGFPGRRPTSRRVAQSVPNFDWSHYRSSAASGGPVPSSFQPVVMTEKCMAAPVLKSYACARLPHSMAVASTGPAS